MQYQNHYDNSIRFFYNQGQYMNHQHSESSKARGNPKRQGDWVCYFCGNYNYSFRVHCNRCQMDPSALNHEMDYQTFEQPEINPRQSIWKIDENQKNEDLMMQNHFRRMVFLTPPKGARRQSSISKREIMGVIQNSEGVLGKQNNEEILKWVAKLVDE